MDNKIKEFYIKEENSIKIPEFKYKDYKFGNSLRFDLVFYTIIILMVISFNFGIYQTPMFNNSGDILEKNKEKIFSIVKDSTVYFHNKEDLWDI